MPIILQHDLKKINFHIPIHKDQGDKRGSDGKRERRNPIVPDIESSYSCGIERAETSIAYSRYAWDRETEAISSTSRYVDEESQRYGGIYLGNTSMNSSNATKINENEVISTTKDVNILPNQVNIEKEGDIQIIESNVLSENKTVSLDSNCKIGNRKNSNLINSTIQNNTII